MFKNLIQLYALIICLICTLILMVNIGFLMNASSEIVFMNYVNRNTLYKYDSNESYLKWEQSLKNSGEVDKLLSLSSLEVEKLRIAEKENTKKEISYTAIKNIINSSIWLIITFLFFIFHWKLHKKSALISNEIKS